MDQVVHIIHKWPARRTNTQNKPTSQTPATATLAPPSDPPAYTSDNTEPETSIEPENTHVEDPADTVTFSDDGNAASTTAATTTEAIEEVVETLPDTLDKSIATIMYRWDKHGSDYGFKSTTDYFSLAYLIKEMTTFNKLDGFYGFTADFTIRLVWNSDPFVQGLYMLAYSPPGAYPPQGLGDPQVVADAMYFSGCPRVIFNINSQVYIQD